MHAYMCMYICIYTFEFPGVYLVMTSQFAWARFCCHDIALLRRLQQTIKLHF